MNRHFDVSTQRYVLVLAWLCLVMGSVWARAADEEPEPARPELKLVLPLAVSPAAEHRLTLRGLHLSDVQKITLRREGQPPLELTIGKRDKAELPAGLEAAQVGDFQIEAELALPGDYPAGSAQLAVTTVAGESEPLHLDVIPAASLQAEQEPNDGFSEAPALNVPGILAGTIHEPRNVDVYRLAGSAGQVVQVRVQARSLGSPLDPLLLVFEEQGRLLATRDDRDDERDPEIELTLPASGVLLLAVLDANDKGSPLHAYLLRVDEGNER